ncbi:MAG: SGNH/GDSL hydrolase family protein [Paenibacillaceae bacterium]|nr:SGNH/GDSL hydrolase family protein [Paenibacillaceae bacterium]
MLGQIVVKQFQARMKAGKAVTVVTYGDSWTYGSVAEGWYDAEDAGYDAESITGSWALRLRKELRCANPNAQLFNVGVGGWTSVQGCEEFATKVAPHRPDYVLVNYGINDWKNGVSLGDYAASMESILRQAEAINCQVVLWTSGPLSIRGVETFGWVEPLDDSKLLHRYAEFTGALHGLAAAHDLPIADAAGDIEAQWRAGTDLSGWFWDSIHFKQEGHDMILRSIMKTLGLT